MDRKNEKPHVLSRHNSVNTNGSNVSTLHPANPSPQPTKNVVKRHTGSLEILEGNASDVYRPDSEATQSSSRPPSQGVQRSWSRSSIGSVPPRPDSSASRRLMTPTKQISLQAVRRKEESSEPFVPDIDFQKLNLDKSYNRAWNLSSYLDEEEVQNTPNFHSSGSDGYSFQHATQLRLPQQRPETDLSTQFSKESQDELNTSNGASVGTVSTNQRTNHQPGPSGSGQQVEHSGNEAAAASSQQRSQNSGTNDDNDSDDDSSEEEGERRAPNELLMEFVECLMKKDYKNADKLCKMILLYEPANPEALKFQPIIEEKLKLDAEAEAANEGEEDNNDDGEDGDDDGEDDDDDDDEDDDSESDDSDSDNEDDDESDDSDDDENQSIFRIMAAAVASNYYESHDSEGNNRPSGSQQ